MTEIAIPYPSARPSTGRAQPRPDQFPRVAEEAIHRAVVDYLERAARPGVAWTHIPSGEKRGPGVGGKLKGMGTKAGWPDLLLIHAGHTYGLELKAERGRVSPAQVRVHAELTLAGATVEVAYGVDQAIAILKRWEVIR